MSRIELLIVIGFGLILAPTACSTGEESAMPEYAPSSPDAAIKAVSLGPGTGDNFDHGKTGTAFPPETTQVAVWYRWEGARPGLRIDNRWSLEGTTVLEQGEAVDESSGREAWFLRMSAGSPLPAGDYRVELLEDGHPVTTIPFRIDE